MHAGPIYCCQPNNVHFLWTSSDKGKRHWYIILVYPPTVPLTHADPPIYYYQYQRNNSIKSTTRTTGLLCDNWLCISCKFLQVRQNNIGRTWSQWWIHSSWQTMLFLSITVDAKQTIVYETTIRTVVCCVRIYCVVLVNFYM